MALTDYDAKVIAHSLQFLPASSLNNDRQRADRELLRAKLADGTVNEATVGELFMAHRAVLAFITSPASTAADPYHGYAYKKLDDKLEGIKGDALIRDGQPDYDIWQYY